MPISIDTYRRYLPGTLRTRPLWQLAVGLVIMLAILLFVPGEYAGPCFIGFAIGESLGASALRIAGGIFTKIADIGSDLMKIVFKIKEDDARNPGVIADCTGDNAGDSVGPTADGFETYGVTGVALITFILLTFTLIIIVTFFILFISIFISITALSIFTLIILILNIISTILIVPIILNVNRSISLVLAVIITGSRSLSCIIITTTAIAIVRRKRLSSARR